MQGASRLTPADLDRLHLLARQRAEALRRRAMSDALDAGWALVLTLARRLVPSRRGSWSSGRRRAPA